MFTNLERRPQWMIRNQILSITPLGTSIEDVIAIIENSDDFGHMHVDFERGLYRPPTGIYGLPSWIGQPARHVGEMYVSAHIGSYRAWYRWFHITGKSIIWGFDEDGALVEVYIREQWGP